MASLDQLEGDALETVGAVVLIGLALLFLYLYVKARNASTNFVSTGFNNVAGNISNGLYNLNAPSAISNPVNAVLSDISGWLDSVFYNPAKLPADYNTQGDSGADETLDFNAIFNGGN